MSADVAYNGFIKSEHTRSVRSKIMNITATAQQVNTAIESASRAAYGRADAVKAATSNKDLKAIFESFDTEVTAGNLTIKATLAGNSVRRHIKITYKVDGKRASKADVENAIAAQ